MDLEEAEVKATSIVRDSSSEAEAINKLVKLGFTEVNVYFMDGYKWGDAVWNGVVISF